MGSLYKPDEPSNLVNAFALQFVEEGAESVIIGLNTNRAQKLLDVFGRRLLVAAKAEEEIGCEMLHCD